MTTIIVIVAILSALLASSVKILKEWERGVVLRLGRALPGEKGPGIILLVPIVDRLIRVDTRTVTLTIPPQEIITRDNISARVTAVALFRVVDANFAITQNVDYLFSTSQVSQTALRSILGQHTLDELLADREKINEHLQVVIDGQTEPWGVKASVVEVKDVEIPEAMRRAIGRQAEAERERRAKVIAAEGEFQASERLTQAANIMSSNPISLQLRYLQTLVEIGAEANTTTVFPLPMDLLPAFEGLRGAREHTS